jgi:DNA-binding cell septation regulator SpoVG
MIELISIHIPKTGGRSFAAILKKIYGQEQLINITYNKLERFQQPLEELIPPDARVLHCILHFPDIAEFYRARQVPIVTWLRDPVERVISNYYFRLERIHVGRRPKHAHRKDETLLEFARREKGVNRMAKFLKGIPLKDVSFVGLLEHFKEDLKDMGRLLGWKGIVKPEHRNNNREFRDQFPPVNQEIREEIKRLNQEDGELYQEALELRNLRRRKAKFFFLPLAERMNR